MSTECRLCSSSNTQLLFISKNIHGKHLLGDEKFNVLECKNCKVTFTDVDVDGAFYGHYYPKNYYDKFRGNKLVESLLAFLEKYSFKRKLRLILRHKPPGNRVLEIGCAQGKFLHDLPPTFKKFGVEINEDNFIISESANLMKMVVDIFKKIIRRLRSIRMELRVKRSKTITHAMMLFSCGMFWSI